jgi:hypothetical protein
VGLGLVSPMVRGLHAEPPGRLLFGRLSLASAEPRRAALARPAHDHKEGRVPGDRGLFAKLTGRSSPPGPNVPPAGARRPRRGGARAAKGTP